MKTVRRYSVIDQFISGADRVLRTLSPNTQPHSQPSPAKPLDEVDMNTAQRKHAAGLMRVNHTGEVCAQALYQGQALTAKLPHIRQEMAQAANEEIDHLAWCDERLQQLGSHTSVLNPLFYGMSFSMGALAGSISDKVSLGFVAATEELVCKHLENHLSELPTDDHKSRAIVNKMLDDEARHQQTALDAGGTQFPTPVKLAMTLLSKAMTKTTYYI